jgi:hypothetical protein
MPVKAACAVMPDNTKKIEPNTTKGECQYYSASTGSMRDNSIYLYVGCHCNTVSIPAC